MAREFKTGLKILGDAKGGVQASRAMRDELDKLDKAAKRGHKSNLLTADSLRKAAVAAAGMAAAAAAAVGVVARFAASVADQGDRIQKLSIQLGTSTEFLSGMAHAAEISGVSLDQFSTGMRKMEKSVGDLSAGLSTQVRAFDRLGLTYQQIKDLSPEDQFLEIADRLGGLQDKTIRTATAMDIFGRSGAELIPLLAEGKVGAEELRAEAERLGLVMSQEFADASAQFNDDLTRMKGVATGVQRQMGEGLLPELTAVMQAFLDNAEVSDVWEEIGRRIGAVVRGLVAAFIAVKETVVLAARAIWAAGKVIVETLVALTAPILEFGNTLSTAFDALIHGRFGEAADAFTGLGTRMKDAFVDNITVVGDTLNEFGTDAKDRIVKAVADVNDVLLRQAEVAQGAAAGMDDLGTETGESSAEADKAAKAFQNLVDRLDPLTALQNKFTVEQAALNAKIAEGGDDVLYYEALLIQLRAEYARATADALGYGDAAVKAGERAAAAAEREADKRAKALQQQAGDLETFQKAFERGVERLDDLGAGLWKNWFTGAKGALASIKDFFLNWLAEMAHAALTRPILVNFLGAFGLTGPAAAIAGVGAGGMGTAAGLAGPGGGLGGLSALSGFGSIANLFTGSSIGLGLQNLPTWLGGTNAGLTTSAGGLFGNAAAYSNWQYGLTGLAAGLLGQKLFGGYGGVGAGLGSTIGLAVGGPLGAILGGLGGGLFGGLFGGKSTPDLYAAGTQSAIKRNPFAVDTALGGLFLGHDDFQDELLPKIVEGLQTFDQAIANFVSDDQLAKITDALKGWHIDLEGEAITMDNLLNSRFKAILGTFSDDIQQYVNEVTGLEDQVQRLGLASVAQRIIDSAPELFEGKTFRDFIAAAERMQAEGEELTATFDRLVQTVARIANQLTLVRGFAGSDLSADYATLTATQTPAQAATGLVDQIRALGEASTGSAGDLEQLSILVSQRYDAEIAYLQQIDSVIAGISDTFRPLRETLQHDILGDEQFYQRIKGQAEDLAASLATMTDPSQIAATLAEINRLTTQAYNLLPEDQRAAMAQQFLAFLDQVETRAQAQLQGERDRFLGESDQVRDLVDQIAEGFGDPLDIAAQAQVDAADQMSAAAQEHEFAALAHEDAADSLMTAAGAIAAAGRGIGIGVGLWTQAIRGTLSDLPASTVLPSTRPSVLTVPAPKISQSTAQAVILAGQTAAAEIRKAGAESAQAIRKSPAQVQNIIQPRSRGMVYE